MFSYKSYLDRGKTTHNAPSPLNIFFPPILPSRDSTSSLMTVNCLHHVHTPTAPCSKQASSQNKLLAAFFFFPHSPIHSYTRGWLAASAGFIALLILMAFGAFSVWKVREDRLPPSQGQTPAYPAGQSVTSQGGFCPLAAILLAHLCWPKY